MIVRREIKEHQHGTNTGYGYGYGCRCNLCKAAHSITNKPHNKLNGAKYRKQAPSAIERRAMKEAEDRPVDYIFIGKRRN